MRGTDPRHLFLYGDHLGSTVQVRDADGKGALRLGYSPFGQVFLKHSDYNHWSPADGSASALEQLGNLMPYQYTGRYTEATTGLVHLDARWYNPQTQRFVQPDLWNFRNTGLPMAVRHELMRFTGLDTAQLLRDPGQQMGYGYVSGNPLKWVDLMGLVLPELIGVEPTFSTTSAGHLLEFYGNHSFIPSGNGDINASPTFVVDTAQATADGLDAVSTGSLMVAGGAALTGPEAIPIVTGAGLVSLVTGLTATGIQAVIDYSKTSDIGDTSLDALGGQAPFIAGQAAEAGLKVAKVPRPAAKAIGTGVEAVGTFFKKVMNLAKEALNDC